MKILFQICFISLNIHICPTYKLKIKLRLKSRKVIVYIMIILCFSVSIDQFIQNLIDIAVQNHDVQKCSKMCYFTNTLTLFIVVLICHFVLILQ